MTVGDLDAHMRSTWAHVVTLTGLMTRADWDKTMPLGLTARKLQDPQRGWLLPPRAPAHAAVVMGRGRWKQGFAGAGSDGLTVANSATLSSALSSVTLCW